MAASDEDGIHTVTEELWSSLPNDLLTMVYARFASPFDRIRFAAVCASWRALASTLPPSRPTLPWLMLDPRGGDKTKRVYCPDDGTVLPRVMVPSEDAGGCFVGGYHGGWVASSEAPLGIVNLLSGAEIVYSPEQRKIIRAQQSSGERLVMRKVVFSTAPTLRGCILAAITDKDGLALCSVGCPEAGWTTRGFHAEERLMDIAFCNGELYGLMRYRDWLVKFEIAVTENGAPILTAVHRLSVQNSPKSGADLDNNARYIVELRGKLVMAVRRGCWWWPHIIKPAAYFTVMEMELVDGDGDRPMETREYKWVNMPSLGDHSLFLGSTSSMAAHVPECGCEGVKRNHVYYSHHRCLLRRGDGVPDRAKVFSIDNGGARVYLKQDNSFNCGVVERLPSVEYFVKGGVCPPTWIFPPEI